MFNLFKKKDRRLRIGIDGGDFCPSIPPKGGIGRLVYGFLSGLTEKEMKANRVLYFSFSPFLDHISQQTYYEQKKLPMRFFSNLFLPLHLFLNRAKVGIFFSGVVPHLSHLFRLKTITCIHDFGFYTFPQYYRDPEKMKWQTEYSLLVSNKILVFSDYIKNQIKERFPEIRTERIVRIYPGSDHVLSVEPKSPGETKPYFLYVGVVKPMKNIETLFHYFNEYIRKTKDSQTRLILIGKAEPDYAKKLRESIVYGQIKDRLCFLESVEDRELVWYYTHAKALINVSHEEGFCYPVIEGLQLGCKVIVNDIPLYREFLPHFPRLHIVHSSEEVINVLSETNDSTDQKKQKKIFSTWKQFTKSLLIEAKSLS